MADSIDDIRIRVASSFDDIDPAEWSKLAGTSHASSSSVHPYNPFVSHAFLSALEKSGSATAISGWLGQHLILEDKSGRIGGALPCYLKNHSRGEYVFDYGWADAFERAGGRYYPKLQASVPFTPATGPRLLAPAGASRPVAQRALAEGLKALAGRHAVSSAHATFVPGDEIGIFEECGFLHRTDQQFHFINRGYETYDDFLESLASRKRKNLRRERRTALEDDIAIDWLSGSDLTENVWDTFFGFYTDTGSRKWGQPYLTRAFFTLIGEAMADDVLLIMAKRNGRYIAGAINFIGADCLYGRHWGCVEDHPFLHFEVCYHQAIDYIIANRMERAEAGAQGEHKLARGYLPASTHSAHFITHPGLRNAIADYLEHEREDVEHVGAVLSRHGPYRKG